MHVPRGEWRSLEEDVQLSFSLSEIASSFGSHELNDGSVAKYGGPYSNVRSKPVAGRMGFIKYFRLYGEENYTN